MFKMLRDVFVNGQRVGQMEVVFDQDPITITHTRESTGEVTMIELTIEEADVLYDLMTLARPTHGQGHPYQK